MAEPSVFAQPSPRHPPLTRRERIAFAVALPLLTALLGIQVLLADRVRWAADAGVRPVLEAVCSLLGCTVPLWHAPEAFSVQQRDIQPHPQAPGALLVTASFRNDAPWPQAWPTIELTLTDLEGQPVGLRRFSPTEYLGAAVPGTPMQPGQSATLALEIVDPGNQAVAFAFAFH